MKAEEKRTKLLQELGELVRDQAKRKKVAVALLNQQSAETLKKMNAIDKKLTKLEKGK